MVWVSDMAEKDRLIQGYKEHLSTKDCMHFNKGQDFCPFGPNCFYRHALPDGTVVSDNVVKRRVNSEGDAVVLTRPFLSDFLEELLSFSAVWVSDMAEKDRLIQGYKEHLSTKDCMHFNKGQDFCPFGPNCFYRHALPDGTVVSDNVVKRRVNSEGDAVVLTRPFLSDFLEELLSFSAPESVFVLELLSTDSFTPTPAVSKNQNNT
eukprot:sb/3470425/